MKILRNAVRCDICEDVIESSHVHDFVQCGCGNVSVDGGHYYIKRNFHSMRFTELTEYEEPDDEC